MKPSTPATVLRNTTLSCDQLGLCQRQPPCRGASCARQHYFVPGAIEHERPKPRRWVWVRRAALLLAVLAAVAYALRAGGVL